MKLLLDIGNTRLKWAVADRGTLGQSSAVLHDGDPLAQLEALPILPVDSIWVADVTHASEHNEALRAALAARYQQPVHLAASEVQWQGLHNAYTEPRRLGIDRWLAMIAAWQANRGAACVIDAGTALTADVIATDGVHQGGLIAAGLRTQQAAVLGATRFATRDQQQPYLEALGYDTETCVRQGALLACLGAIDRAARAAGPGARLLITGGDAPTLRPLLSGVWQFRPLLVLEGLLALSGA